MLRFLFTRRWLGLLLVVLIVWIEDVGMKLSLDEIAAGPRIGIAYAEEFAAKPWRFWIKDNVYVSRKG